MIEIGGGESIFKKVGRTFRTLWIDSVNESTDSLRQHRLQRQILLDFFRKEENKRAPEIVAAMVGKPEKVEEGVKEITTILTDEEKARQEKLAEIRDAAAKLDQARREKQLEDEKLFKLRLDAIRAEGTELAEEEKSYEELTSRILERIINQSEARKNAKEEEREAHARDTEAIKNDIIARTDLEIAELERRNEVIKTLEQINSDNKIRIASAATDVLAGIAGKNKALQKASLIADKALAIAEIIIQTKKANAMLTVAQAAMLAIFNYPGAALAEATKIKNNIAAGISIAAIVAATVTGLASFQHGGKITDGAKANTGTKDDTLILVNKTETVLTQDHVARLGGSGAMRKIGVPGYAGGGYIGQSAPEIQASGFDINQLAALMNSIEVTLNINKLNSAQKELDIINKTQAL